MVSLFTGSKVFQANLLSLVHRGKPTHTVVNCWFCNHDTLVPYGNRNCWDCPHCEQYNGFQEVRAGGAAAEPASSSAFHTTVF